MIPVMLSFGAIGLVWLGYLLLMPNKMSVGPGREESLAVTRAEAVNMAIAAFIQHNGRTVAEEKWYTAGSAEERYDLLVEYLAFAPVELADYMPRGYSVKLPSNLKELWRVPLEYHNRKLRGFPIRY